MYSEKIHRELETFIMNAWGMFCLSVIYTIIMIRGIYNYWFEKEVK